MSQPLLEVKNLKVSFHTYAGEVQAVRGVDFTLDAGDFQGGYGADRLTPGRGKEREQHFI